MTGHLVKQAAKKSVAWNFTQELRVELLQQPFGPGCAENQARQKAHEKDKHHCHQGGDANPAQGLDGAKCGQEGQRFSILEL